MNVIGRFGMALLVFAGLIAFGRADAFAHALDPAYLEVRAVGGESYAAAFKVPQIRGQPMALRASLPENCAPRSSEQLVPHGRAFVASWVALCPGGLAGGQLSVDGLALTARCTRDDLQRHPFYPGQPVWLVFQATSIRWL